MSAIEDLPQGKLESLGEHAKRAAFLQQYIDDKTAELEGASNELREILEKKMPDIMQEIGISDIKLITGEKLIMKPYYSASISAENPKPAFDWLKENGHDSIIKNEVKAIFGKGSDNLVEKLMGELNKLMPDTFNQKKSVHASTLKSFVKELVEAGTPPPAELFHLYIGNKVTIK